MSSDEQSDDYESTRDVAPFIHVRELYDRVASAPSVYCVRELDIWDPDVTIAFDVQTMFGWTQVLAVAASTDAEELIGSLYIRTQAAASSAPADEWLERAQRIAVLACCSLAADKAGIEVQSRLPMFLNRAAFESLVPVVEQIIWLHGLALEELCGNRLHARFVALASGPYRPSREQLRFSYKALHDGLPREIRLIELDTGCVLIDERHGPDAARVEVVISCDHELFGSLVSVELVVPWMRARGTDVHEAATFLNRSEEGSEDGTLGVGAWYARGEDGSVRYRVLLPFSERWAPDLHVFVANLRRRWTHLSAANPNVPSDFDLAGSIRTLFTSMRSTGARVLRVEHLRDCSLSADERYSGREAGKGMARSSRVSVRSVARNLEPLPRRPRAHGKRKRRKR